MQQQIMSRKQAKLGNHNKYWSGEKCRNNHSAMRYTSNGVCTQCQLEQNKKQRGLFQSKLQTVTITVDYRGVAQLKAAAETINQCYANVDASIQGATQEIANVPAAPPAPPHVRLDADEHSRISKIGYEIARRLGKPPENYNIYSSQIDTLQQGGTHVESAEHYFQLTNATLPSTPTVDNYDAFGDDMPESNP